MISIEEWASEERARLIMFLAIWVQKHSEEPEKYPYDMEPSDWDEAYEVFGEQVR